MHLANQRMTTGSKRHPTAFGAALPEGEPRGIADIHDALVIREGDLFLLTDENGNVPSGHARGLGLYHADTRHLSTFNFYFHTSTPVVLLSTAELGFASEHVLTNPMLRMTGGQIVPAGTIEVRRQRVISGLLEETLQITNYHSEPVELQLHLELAADFANIFEVRGLLRKRRGDRASSRVVANHVTYEYRGADRKLRHTVVTFSPRPHSLSASGAILRVRLKPRQTWTMRMTIAASAGGPVAGLNHARRGRLQLVVDSYQRWLSGCTQVVTDNGFFNRALARSLSDLRMLWLRTEDGASFPAAGTPWFDALFGRDALIMGFQTLAFRPAIARDTLRALARWQGRDVDPNREEEPGKILHEFRRGELSMSGGPALRPYFGSIDATLLFLLLIAEYYAWTNDRRFLQQLRPNILAAIDWMYAYGDPDRDGYVEYEKRSPAGLDNQGWKDSSDAIVHADGSIAPPPLALVEVQAYLYALKRRLVPVLQTLGLAGIASRFAGEARTLRRRFHKDFWLPEERFYSLALDGSGHPCATVTSNVGHALWCGVITRQHARAVIERALANDLFSGWGVRTLSRSNPRYNPLGYHLGTVWPHDSAIAAFGFKMYGCEEEANEVATALFDAAMSFPYMRLPELFGGEARAAHHPPVPYPVACRPQGWAAGAFPMLLHAIFGLAPDAPNGVLRIVRPSLPDWLETAEVRGLRVGRGQVDLRYRRRGRRTAVDVLESTGDVRVVLADRWPL